MKALSWMTGLLVMAAGAGVLAQEKGAADKAGHGAHSGAMMGLKKELIEGITEADFLKLGEAPKTVDITLVTTFTDANHGMNFNGFSHGQALYKIPVGWKVKVRFINPSPVPHSAIVIERYDVKKLQVTEPYFEGAAVEKHIQGLAYAKAEFEFTAEEEGEFALACGFPSHALAGHWLALEVVGEDQRPSLKLGEAGEEKVLK